MSRHFEVILPPFSRGIHLITEYISPELSLSDNGILNIFIQHTSAGICINENADPSVRRDMEGYLDRLVPEDQPEFTHTMEGPDDMPAHIKSMMTGHSVSIPVRDGRMMLGTWQGIYLCEFRDHAQGRRLVGTVVG